MLHPSKQSLSHIEYKLLFEMEEKFITQWGGFDSLLCENGAKFVLKWKMNVRVYMASPLIKTYECSFEKTHLSSLLCNTHMTVPLVKSSWFFFL